GRDRAFTLVEHLHVAAQRQRADDELGAVRRRLAAPQHTAETDRETQHLDAARHRDAVVPVLVDHDQHAEREHESQKRGDHRARPFTKYAASARAGSSSSSSASTESREPLRRSTRASVWALTL